MLKRVLSTASMIGGILTALFLLMRKVSKGEDLEVKGIVKVFLHINSNKLLLRDQTLTKEQNKNLWEKAEEALLITIHQLGNKALNRVTLRLTEENSLTNVEVKVVLTSLHISEIKTSSNQHASDILKTMVLIYLLKSLVIGFKLLIGNMLLKLYLPVLKLLVYVLEVYVRIKSK